MVLGMLDWEMKLLLSDSKEAFSSSTEAFSSSTDTLESRAKGFVFPTS